MIKRILEPVCEVYLARHGKDGLNQVRWVKPALILLDIRMPGIDGLTVLAQLKAEQHTRDIPVVIVSARGDYDILLEGQQLGAADQLIKPFTPVQLRKVVALRLQVHGDTSGRANAA